MNGIFYNVDKPRLGRKVQMQGALEKRDATTALDGPSAERARDGK